MNLSFEFDNVRVCGFCYSVGNEILIDYLPVKYLYSDSGEFILNLSNAVIPAQASHICMRAYDGEMNLVEERQIEISKERTRFSDKPTARIAVISDLHTIQKGKSLRLLSEAFNGIKEHGADFVLSSGDIVNGCQQGEFDIISNSLNNHLGNIPFYSALGNHDYFSNNEDDTPCNEARDGFLNRIKQQNKTVEEYKYGSYSVIINGIKVIFLDCIQGNRKFGFDDDLAAWLKAELDNSQSDGFRIVVNHLPLASHNLGCNKKHREFMAGNGKLQSIIDNSKNIIYISGYTHNRLDSDFPSAEQDERGNIYINAGSVGNTQPCVNDIKNLKNTKLTVPKNHPLYKEIDRYFKMSSMGLFLNIYEDFVLVNGFDFSQKKWIPRCSFAFSNSIWKQKPRLSK